MTRRNYIKGTEHIQFSICDPIKLDIISFQLYGICVSDVLQKAAVSSISHLQKSSTLILQRSIMEVCNVVFESLQTKLILRCDNSNESCWTVKFPVVLLIMLYKVVFTFESSDEIFWRGQVIETFSAKIVIIVLLFQYSTKLKLGISFFNFNIWLLQAVKGLIQIR